MAQNYIILTLDTTAPDVEVFVPTYTTQLVRTEIRVVASESLSDWQEIYAIDSTGKRHDLIFRHDKDLNEYVGQVIFNDYPLGMTTIYARLKDDVGNLSSLVSKSFKLVKSDVLDVAISEEINDVDTTNREYTLVSIADMISDIDVESEGRFDVIIKTENRNNVIVIDGNAYLVVAKDKDYISII